MSLYCHVHVCPPQKTVYGASVIIFEGIMSFADKKLLQVGQGYRDLFLSVHVIKHVFCTWKYVGGSLFSV